MPKRSYSKKRSYKRSSKKIRTYGRNSAALSKPPCRDLLIKQSHTFRYVASEAYNGNINCQMVMAALGTMGTGSTPLQHGTLGSRSSHLRCGAGAPPLAPPPLASPTDALMPTPVCRTQTATFLGGNLVPRTFSDSSVGTAVPAHLKSYPPKGTLAQAGLALWIQQHRTQRKSCLLMYPKVPY